MTLPVQAGIDRGRHPLDIEAANENVDALGDFAGRRNRVGVIHEQRVEAGAVDEHRARAAQMRLVLVTVRLAPSAVTRDVRPALTLEAPPGVRVETPCVWAPALREGAWRIAAERSGQYDLRVTAGGAGATKRVVVSTAVAARTPRRPAPALWDQFLNPGEPPLFAASPIESIEVRYPARALGILGFTMPWIVAFFVLTSVFMVAGRSLVNVVL